MSDYLNVTPDERRYGTKDKNPYTSYEEGIEMIAMLRATVDRLKTEHKY